tara:strand:- start:581 stop:1378 length:798 start_codon:yes stop_codon:yes gene_type:complete
MEFKSYRTYANFLKSLSFKLTRFYNEKLDKNFVVYNKRKGKGYDPVTTSDRAFEKFIRNEIKKRFPTHQIIGEEFGKNKSKSEFSWIIDPIDGTRSYVTGNPTWSNLIALNHNGSPVLGLANFPKLNKFYMNINKKTAYVYENKKKRRLKVNKKTSFKNIKLAAAFHGWLPIKKQLKIKNFLNKMQFPCFDALTYAQLAEGRLDVVVQCANKIWDIHPLIPIIKAAGGIVTTWENKSPILAGNIIVSNNQTNHEKILKLLKPALK